MVVLGGVNSSTLAAELFADAVAAADVVVVGGAPNAIEQQLRAQFEPMLKVELSFVNRVCKLTDEERRNLISKSNDWLKKFIADYAKRGGQPQFNVAWMAGGRPQAADPRESIENGVAKLVQSELPKPKAAKYQEEARKRAEFQKQAFVENLVTRIDHELILAPEQRDKIHASLTEHWEKSWQGQLEMFVHGVDMWPAVPDQWIRPHLSAVQQIAWGRLNKNHGHTIFGGFPAEGQIIDDIDLTEGQESDGAKNEAAPRDKPAAAVLAAPVRAN
jgi:hypothetical protein